MLLLVLVVACRVPWFRHQRRQEGGPAPLAWAGVVAGGRLRRPSRQIYVSWLRSERECRLLLSLVRIYWYEVRCILFCLSTAHTIAARSRREQAGLRARMQHLMTTFRWNSGRNLLILCGVAWTIESEKMPYPQLLSVAFFCRRRDPGVRRVVADSAFPVYLAFHD